MALEQVLKIGGRALTQARKAYVRPACETVNGQCILKQYLKSFNEQKLISTENSISTNIRNYYQKIYNMFVLDGGQITKKAQFEADAEKMIQEITSFNDPILEKQITQLMLSEGNQTFQIDKIIDCIHTLHGDYESISAYKRTLNILNLITNKAKRMDMKPQAMHDTKIQTLKAYIDTYGNNPKSQNIAKHLYKKYYLKYNCPCGDTRGAYHTIADDYGTLVFARNAESYSLLYASDIRNILRNWAEAGQGKANLPRHLNITELNEIFIKEANCNGFAQNRKDIYLPSPNNVRWRNILDHEIAHLNYKCPIKITDLQTNPWYRQQLEKIECDNIDYALTDGNELVATIMQCDLSKITPEFKNFLIKDLKVPEWMFNLKHLL